MSDWTELKRLAEDTKGWQELRDFWPVEEEDCDPSEFSWEIGAINEGEKYEVITVNTWQYDEPYSSEKLARYYAAANPKTILALIAENERLQAALSAPETITAEPAADYEALRKQFMSLRMLANSNAKMVQHWRDQSGRETRETLLANAANVNAERDTNAMLTDALEVAEQERDQLRAEVDALRKIIGATEHGYCSEIGRCLCGGDTVGVRSTCGSWVKFK